MFVATKNVIIPPPCFQHDLSKYTDPTKVVGMLMVLALPTKVVGMQASNQIQEPEWSNFHLVDCQINYMKTLATEFL